MPQVILRDSSSVIILLILFPGGHNGSVETVTKLTRKTSCFGDNASIFALMHHWKRASLEATKIALREVWVSLLLIFLLFLAGGALAISKSLQCAEVWWGMVA